MRHTWRYFVYDAECRDCGWRTRGKNALGLGAQHYNRTGHTVAIDVEGNVTYCGDAENARRVAAKQGGR